MSTCISGHGEYSAHQIPATGHPYLEERLWPWACGRCGVLDENALLDALADLRARLAERDAQVAAVGALIPAENPELIEAGYALDARDALAALGPGAADVLAKVKAEVLREAARSLQSPLCAPCANELDLRADRIEGGDQ